MEQGDELISRNWEQQLFFARSMMAMQLGGVTVRRNENGRRRPSTEIMSNIIAHGGRLVGTLPNGDGEQQDRMLNAVVGRPGECSLTIETARWTVC